MTKPSTAATRVSTAALADGLVLAVLCNENTGNALHDQSGQGTVLGIDASQVPGGTTPAWGTNDHAEPAWFAGGTFYTGADDRLGRLRGHHSFTMMLRAKQTSSVNGAGYLAFGSSIMDQGVGLMEQTAGKLSTSFYSDDRVGTLQIPLTGVFYVATFRYDASTNIVTLRIDTGTTVSETFTNTLINFQPGNALRLLNHLWSGVGDPSITLDWAYFWDLALTDANVTSIIATPYAFFGVATATPVASFTLDLASPTTNDYERFVDTSTGVPTAWAWDFGDGNTSTAQVSTHRYDNPGTYTVSLTSTNSFGTNTHTQSVVVTLGVPQVSFNESTTNVDQGVPIQFNDTSRNAPTAWSWNWGDGTAAGTTQNPTHAFTVAGLHTVTLTATNATGPASGTAPAITTTTAIIPLSSFTVPATALVGQLVDVFDTTTHNPTTWDWNWGDGTAHDTTQNATHIYTTPGTKTITIIVTNFAGTDTTNHAVTVSAATSPSKPGIATTTVVASGLTTGLVYAALFNEGSGSSVTDYSGGAHTYAASGAGVWNVNETGSPALRFGDQFLDIPSIGVVPGGGLHTLTVFLRIRRDFAIGQGFWAGVGTPAAGVNTTVSMGENSTHAWRNDSASNIDASQVPALGSYIGVALRYGATAGQADLLVQGMTIIQSFGVTLNVATFELALNRALTDTIHNPYITFDAAYVWNRALTDTEITGLFSSPYSFFTPTTGVSFTFTPASPTAGAAVSFTSSSVGGTPTAWDWNWGDGTAHGTTQNPVHTFASAATFTVTLTATIGGTYTVGHAVVVGLAAVPAGAFSFSPASPVAGSTVSFTDGSTNSPTAWDWNWGDATAHGATQNPSHAFSAVGTYTVTLTPYNALGTGTPVSHAVTVTAPSATVGAFTSTPPLPFTGGTVTFTDGSTNGPTAWDWNFGDTTAHGTTQNPTHAYVAVGTYTVTLTPSNILGSGTLVTHAVTVSAAPVPIGAFTFTPATPGAGATVSFTDGSTNNPTSWDWNFGDATAHSTSQNPIHAYAAAGAYTVTLTPSNTYGASTPVSHAITVSVGPQTRKVAVTIATSVPLGVGSYVLASPAPLLSYQVADPAQNEILLKLSKSFTLDATGATILYLEAPTDLSGVSSAGLYVAPISWLITLPDGTVVQTASFSYTPNPTPLPTITQLIAAPLQYVEQVTVTIDNPPQPPSNPPPVLYATVSNDAAQGALLVSGGSLWPSATSVFTAPNAQTGLRAAVVTFYLPPTTGPHALTPTGTKWTIPVNGTRFVLDVPPGGGTLLSLLSTGPLPLGTVQYSQGTVWRGAWSSVTAYNTNDMVNLAGNLFVALLPNTNVVTTATATWYPIPTQGATGTTGATGAAGGTGPTGPTGATGPSTYQPFLTKTAAYTMATGDPPIAADATAAAMTITLPSATGATMRVVVKKIDSTANIVTVAGAGGATLDGVTTKTLTTQWQSIELVGSGANWLIVT